MLPIDSVFSYRPVTDFAMFTPLIVFLVMAALVIVAIEVRERKRAGQKSRQSEDAQDDNRMHEDAGQRKKNENASVMSDGSVCCGMHLVCERESLLNESDEVVYYDDEHLDDMKGIDAADYTPEQTEMVAEVFRTMREEDVVGWVKSLQLRGIELPLELRDEVLLVVQEQRAKSRNTG